MIDPLLLFFNTAIERTFKNESPVSLNASPSIKVKKQHFQGLHIPVYWSSVWHHQPHTLLTPVSNCQVLFTLCARLTCRWIGACCCLFVYFSLCLSVICIANPCHNSQGFTQMSHFQWEPSLFPIRSPIFCAWQT